MNKYIHEPIYIDMNQNSYNSGRSENQCNTLGDNLERIIKMAITLDQICTYVSILNTFSKS